MLDESIVRTIRNSGRIRSSARHVSGILQWINERNPYCLLYVSGETASVDLEEGGDDVKSAWPFDALGYTHDTMGSNNGLPSRKAELIPSNLPPVRIGGCNLPP